jgi:hypothetical protein
LAQHAEASEEIDEQDNPLSTLFYIDSQILPIAEHPWYKDLVYYLQNKKMSKYLRYSSKEKDMS